MKLKSIERIVSRVHWDARIFWEYGTRHPRAVLLPGQQRVLYVDSHDYRARKKIVANCCLRGRVPRNQRFWRLAIRELTPSTALDIGLNYGECLFTTDYEPQTRLFAFEANTKLRPLIEASLAEHPNRNQIECCYQLASDTDDAEADFWVNKHWSGGSTASGTGDDAENARLFEKTIIPQTTIDRLLTSRAADPEKLFFKIDVEGFEYRVLCGMRQSLEQARQAVGFIEFDPELLQRAGEDVDDFWGFLNTRFRVSAFDRDDQWHDCRGWNLNQLATVCGKSFHTDLVLVKGESDDAAAKTVEHLRRQWSTEIGACKAA